MKACQSRSVRWMAACTAILSALLVASCEKPARSVADVPDDPSDETLAFLSSAPGENMIYWGKLHSHQFKKLCSGDNPSISPSGRFVAYNPPLYNSPHPPPKLAPIKVIAVETGNITSFDSIPRDLTPHPGCFWSSDEKLIAFPIYDWGGNRVRGVVSMVDGSFWQGTDAEFDAKYAKAFSSTEINARHSVEGRLSIENFKRVGALYFHPRAGKPIRLTPETMAVATTPIWIERTGEALFAGSFFSRNFFDPDNDHSEPAQVYLIKPEAKDWANASRNAWKEAIAAPGVRFSVSR